MLAEYEEDEEHSYRRAQEAFEKRELERAGGGKRVTVGGGSVRESYADLEGEPFFSYEEYTRYRELKSRDLYKLYHQLLAEPEIKDVELKGDVKGAFEDEDEWEDMNSYDKWVVQLFHREVVDMFGGLTVVDKALLPIGLMNMLRQSRFQWQG
ncbi:hypothetical protein B0T20DRAFT_344466 [Sordaria brevicollis]|uniref:Uncharacterized protein n=1 Tax=Sordaria brevicollis TaxID=83679 RepID=A0AAE0UG50_SORBR|nr:hypothetical protein B0T20DRAFT_344466 [Sordaria brevicollis]